MSKGYDPKRAIRGATKAMNSYTSKHTPPSERPLTLSSNGAPVPCAVLLRSFTENGPVPDDFKGLPKTSAALKAHVRPDGAVYIGAFQSQGAKDSVVLVYGPAKLTEKRAEEISCLERRALIKRHESFLLGPFAAPLSPRADGPSVA